ncbi:hypothetical protein THMIRHAM_12090 [Thiomicrorhabdus immobilis]|uniref:Plasminogen-binding protein PgbA N-terminal domain-containing protein n=1 Tax=Thiomicrorhabdus immobilis TaxID=2791037 RepID=A0ABM7MDK2_9GAMM|nr:hypothetical protein [Thiomicrorhabdus immobilis]BCN93424.1 hypothetical protein THMIRHAM_12090 [Thiomicrorhabdus immobilis]
MKHVYKQLAILGSLLVVCLMLGKANAVEPTPSFSVGDTIFVAYPAPNIKDDAFIVGKVNKVMPNGDYKISVLDYVEGHDYGVSCVPMVKHETTTSGDDMAQVWELWTDTTKLESQKLDYLVSHKDALELGYGKSYFIERNNLYIVFGRWKSDAPMLNAERIQEAEKQAKLNGLQDMVPAFELARLDRMSFYGDYGRPLQAFESIAPMVKTLARVQELFDADAILKRTWFSKQRDWKQIAKSTRQYFLIEAIDKVVDDAKSQLHQEGIDQAAPEDLAQLRKYIEVFARK